MDAHSPQPGTLIAGRYQLERVLRSGRTAARYLVRDTQEGMRPLAMHEWPVYFTATEARTAAADWLERRVRWLQQLANPGFCALRDLHVLPALEAPFYLLTDHQAGLTLAEEREESDGELSWRRIVDWGIDLCETLAYLHTQTPSWILGSLQPDAVVLATGAGRPVIRDPGLQRRLDPTALHLGYVPFEQYLGREEAASDLYAVGAILHYLVSGRDPDVEYARLRRAGLDVQRTLRALFPPLEATAFGIPSALTSLIARCTAFAVSERYTSAATLRQALLAVRGPAAATETATAKSASDQPVWQQLGLTQEQWFALPLAERNRRLLGIVAQEPGSAGA